MDYGFGIFPNNRSFSEFAYKEERSSCQPGPLIRIRKYKK